MALADAVVDETSTVAGRYRRDFVLGRGSVGEVWAATDLVLHRWVALRAVDGPVHQPALDEAKAAARLHHPALVTVHDVLGVDGLLLVTEYVGGGSLADHVGRHGPVDVGTVAALGARLAGGLAAAHAEGLVHAHLTPADVLLTGTDPTDVKLAGFGLVHARRGSFGTPAHLAPERIAGHAPAAPADVYSLGSTLWFALTGRAPFERETVDATLEAAATAPLPPVAATGPVVELLVRALDRNPLRRPSAAELAAGLAPHVPGDTARAAWATAPVADDTASHVIDLRPAADGQPAASPVWTPPPPTAAPPPVDPTGPIEPFRAVVTEEVEAPPPRRLGRVLLVLVASLAVIGLLATAGVALLSGDAEEQAVATQDDDDRAGEADSVDEADDEDQADEDTGAEVGDGGVIGQAGQDDDVPEAADEGADPDPDDDADAGAGGVAYADPQGGFEVVLPEGLAVELDEGTHLTQATAGDLRIAIRWFDDPVDPAGFIAAEEERLLEFPGYERLELTADGDDVSWTFTFAQPSDPGRLLRSTGRAFVVEGRTYAVFVRAADPADVDTVLAGIATSFVATP